MKMKTEGKGIKFLSIMLTVLLSVTALSACNQTRQQSDTEAAKLVTYNNYQTLKNVISKNMKNALASGRLYAMSGKAINETAALSDSTRQGTDASLQDYSTTNLQVEGVDEADMVKTDGTYLYLVANGRFIIVDAKDPAAMKIISQIQYVYENEPAKNTVTPIEMFLDEENNRITLISYSYDDRQTNAMLTEAAKNPSKAAKSGTVEGSSKDRMIAPDYSYGYFGQQNVLAQVIDLKDIAKPAVVREFSQEGNYLSSRRIGEYVYIITNKYLYSYEENANTDYYIPATKDSKGTGTWEMLPIGSIHVIPDEQSSSFLVLSSINAKDLDSKPQSMAVLGGGQNVYASTTNIYIASTRYIQEQSNSISSSGNTGTAATTNTKTDPSTQVGTAREGSTSAQAGSGQTASVQSASTSIQPSSSQTASHNVTDSVTTGQKTAGDAVITKDSTEPFKLYNPPVYNLFTDIYRFGINKGVITEKGSGVVPGYILNQFSMDENNGYFRIATTTGDSWRMDGYTSMNNIYVLDQNLKTTGKIEGLASRETIKSVRFTGNKAYLVTFRTVDPLFVLDLSDPAKPVVKGELKIPGYSEYLHPISDTIIIGFGKDALEENNMAYYLGMKVSVFDVSDVSHPKEISTMIIGDRGTNSEITTNHKALLYSAEKNIIGFPITIYEVPESQKSDPKAYGMPTFVGYMVLGLTADNKLVEKGRVSHYTLAIPEGYSNDSSTKTAAWQEYEKKMQYEYFYHVSRGVFIGETLFTVSNAVIKANSLKDYSETGKIDVPGFTTNYMNKGIYALTD